MKNTIIGIAVGIFLACFVYQVYVNWEFQKAWNADHQTLSQVVQFLQQATSKPNPTK